MKAQERIPQQNMGFVCAFIGSGSFHYTVSTAHPFKAAQDEDAP